MILFLLMAGIDPDIKNNAGQKAGEKSPKEIKDFVTFLKGFFNSIFSFRKLYKIH